MATTLILTASQTWVPPVNCPVGTAVTVEAWGGGSGGTGRVSSTFGAAGAGGAYASNPYVITPHDAASGIVCTVGGGTTGLSGANPAAGGITSFSVNTNLVRNSTNQGTAKPSTLPNMWAIWGGGGLTQSVVNFGTSSTGNPYTQIRLVGTTTATDANFSVVFDSAAPAGAATYAFAIGVQIVAGSLANISGVIQQLNTYSDINANTYVSSVVYNGITPTTSMAVYQGSGAAPAGTLSIVPLIEFDYATGAAIDITLQFEAVQIEVGATFTYFSPSPGYTKAAGGGAPAGTTGGTGGTTAASVGTVRFAGGSGAAYNAGGSGGGGSGGKDGAGVAGTTAGVGGRGDASTGGTGGAVKATTPGNPGTANAEGGGGGGGLITVAGTGGAGAIPGGGGGGAAVATGTGGTGARGQIRLTYTEQVLAYARWRQLAPILAQ